MTDLIYYNINQTNNSVASVPLTFNTTRTIKILDKSSNYAMAIVRFDVPGSALPLMYFRIEEGAGQTDPDLGLYQIAITYLGTPYYVTLSYMAQDLTIPVPLPPSENNGLQVRSEYYYIHSYQHFIDILNTALATSFADFKADVPASPQTETAYFQYNEENQLISLVTPADYVGDITVRWNQALENLIQHLDVIKIDQDEFELVVRDTGDNAYFRQLLGAAPPATADYLIFSQEYFNSHFRAVRSILIKTNILPVPPEQVEDVLRPGGNQYTYIVTDFDVDHESAGRIKQHIIYNPQPQYRYIEMTSDTALYRVQLSFEWQNSQRETFPVLLSPYETADVKLLFQRRGTIGLYDRN